MYNSKMWLVVKPSTGVPLFFAGVALTSLAIHTAVLTNTTWFPAFFNGRNRPPAAAVAAAPAAVPAVATAAATESTPQTALASAQSALASAQLAIASVQPALAAIQTSIAPPSK